MMKHEHWLYLRNKNFDMMQGFGDNYCVGFMKGVESGE